jgi:hypothetical protein
LLALRCCVAFTVDLPSLSNCVTLTLPLSHLPLRCCSASSPLLTCLPFAGFLLPHCRYLLTSFIPQRIQKT